MKKNVKHSVKEQPPKQPIQSKEGPSRPRKVKVIVANLMKETNMVFEKILGQCLKRVNLRITYLRSQTLNGPIQTL